MKHRPLVGIDIRMARYTGIGRYIRDLTRALDSQPPAPWKYKFISGNAPVYSLREQIAIPILARHCDCLHVPHYNIPVFWKRKLVVTIHDLIHLHFQDQFSSPLAPIYAKILLPWAVRRADAIIAVSNYTKNDLIKTLDVPPRKITVIHHGVDAKFLALNGSNEKVCENKFFLFVGLMKPHKNLGILLEAFLQLKKETKREDLNLIIVGKPDKRQERVQKWLQTIQSERSIILKNEVNEEHLKALYRSAIALVFPSLHEGFGFPLLEAMASKTPIIASHATSIPEVVGQNAALYFDPLSVSELKEHMKLVLENEDLRKRLIKEGSDRISLFSWKKSAEMTKDVYDRVLSS